MTAPRPAHASYLSPSLICVQNAESTRPACLKGLKSGSDFMFNSHIPLFPISTNAGHQLGKFMPLTY